MSSGDVRRVSRQDIQLVQDLIERCLQLYMNQQEVVQTLLAQAKIEPGFTELVWQKLEEENRDFFKAYNLRLLVKQQIIVFNKLVEQQAAMMHRMRPTAVSSIPISNGSHISPLPQNSAYALEHPGPTLNQDNMHSSIGSSFPNAFTNGGSSLHSSMHTGVDMSAHARRIDAPSNMVPSQNSNMGMIQGFNGMMIKSEAGYSSGSSFVFGAADGNTLETRPTMADASFSSTESNPQPLNEPLMDANAASFGCINQIPLSQIPRNFSFSDLTDFSHSSEILDGYSRSPFLDTDQFLNSCERGERQVEDKRLDTISEGLSYEDFGSD